MAEATPFLPGLSPVWTKSLTAAQDAGNLSSNGGLVVLREAARRAAVERWSWEHVARAILAASLG